VSRRYYETFPIIYTADLAEAMGFYRGLLGFEETFRYPAEGEPEYVAFQGIGLAATTEGQVGLHGWPVAPHSGGFELCVYTDDVDAAVEELRAHGVLILTEPADQPWGERMAYVADPDDHPVMLAQKLSAA
jgi:lactoylglutathione lyase